MKLYQLAIYNIRCIYNTKCELKVKLGLLLVKCFRCNGGGSAADAAAVMVTKAHFCIRLSNLETIVLPCKLGSTASAAMCCGNTVVPLLVGSTINIARLSSTKLPTTYNYNLKRIQILTSS